MCVHAQDPERRMEEKGLQCGHPPWGVISHFLSLCLSGERTCPIAKTSQIFFFVTLGTRRWHSSYVNGLPHNQPRFKSQPRWLKNHASGICIHAQDPKRRMEEKGLKRGHPPWGVISHFLSLCLFGKCTCPIAKTPPKKKTDYLQWEKCNRASNT